MFCQFLIYKLYLKKQQLFNIIFRINVKYFYRNLNFLFHNFFIFKPIHIRKKITLIRQEVIFNAVWLKPVTLTLTFLFLMCGEYLVRTQTTALKFLNLYMIIKKTICFFIFEFVYLFLQISGPVAQR